MLEGLVGKVEDFQGDTISLNYLRPDCEQLIEEMMFPVPEWAQGECLRKRVCEEEGVYTNIRGSRECEEAESVFVGAQPDLNSLMEQMKRKSGRKRKRD